MILTPIYDRGGHEGGPGGADHSGAGLLLELQADRRLYGDHPGGAGAAFYGRWSSTYVSDAFRGGNQTVIDLLDRLTEGYTEEQIQNLEHILINCSKYEYQFWDMLDKGRYGLPSAAGKHIDTIYK